MHFARNLFLEGIMLKRTFLVLLALVTFPSLAFADNVTATIDGNCAAKNASLVVPAGKTATGFSVATLAPGSKCKVGGVPDSKGWGIIKNGGKVYYWSQFKSNQPSEVGGLLINLVLQPGTYEVFVDGGSGATATINFTVK
jgi:hypothetical protein